ncbi:MAG: tetratricopeptide repeat protein [Paludibacter sp.]|nr:tetratricopeptide repeat protein [Paludibacter sp.]
MLYKFRIFIYLFLLLLTGCVTSPNELKIAEQILETSPDSALHLLQNIKNTQLKSDENRALYGILLFQALDKTNSSLPADSVINFSINYYKNTFKNNELAIAYYYKARLYKIAQRFDKATELYLKAQDLIQNSNQNYLLGKIYSDMGDICSFQKDYKEALLKFQQSKFYFQKANDLIETSYKLIDIGRVWRLSKNFKKAFVYYNSALTQTVDSFVNGAALQEIGINYYNDSKYDSALIYLNKSLLYPFKGTNYAIRCYVLADIYYRLNRYESAIYYSNLSFKYPNTYIIQRESFRILANTEYKKGDFKKTELYMGKYQDCTDSVRKIEIQTKSSVLEDIYITKGTVQKSKKYVVALISFILLIISLSIFIFLKLRKRSKSKDIQLKNVEIKLINKQVLLKESLIKKIEETRLSKSTSYKKADIREREQIDIEIYTFCLHLDDWGRFEKLMNQTFNNLFIVLYGKSTDINRKELILCSLLLLEVPTTDILIILDCQLASLYKLRQRIVQKLNLSGTKEFEQFLQDISTEK